MADLHRTSHYLTMRDGVRLAVDVSLPVGVRRAPTILRQSRHCRSVNLPRSVRRVRPLALAFEPVRPMRESLVASGNAWVYLEEAAPDRRVTTAYNIYHWDYSTGSRCCADLTTEASSP